ncbi:MAG: glycosyltransferase [Acidobacteriota bacterium]
MKIVLVGPAYPYRGGIAQYNTSLFHALRREHEPCLISFSRQYPALLFPGRTQHDQSRRPLTAASERLLDPVDPLSWRETARRILEKRPDLVVFQWWQPFFGPAFAGVIRRFKRKLPLPTIYCCHNVYPHDRSGGHARRWLEKSVIRYAFREVDGFLVHAESMVAEVRSFRPDASVRRIYHPLYTFYSDLAGDSEPETRSPKAAVPRLLFFGKVRPYKGLDTLIAALGILNREGIQFQARIAGEFYLDAGRYRALASREGLGGRIEWWDRYIPNEEVPALFREADVVVLPYTEATQSGVVPVAYQFGVPVIATRVGGLSEVVLEGRTGLLVPPRDPAALAAAVRRFLSEGLLQDFRQNILEFRRLLTWEQAVETLVDLASEVVARHKCP